MSVWRMLCAFYGICLIWGLMWLLERGVPRWIQTIDAHTPWYMVPVALALRPALGFVDSMIYMLSIPKKVLQWADEYEAERSDRLLELHEKKQRAKAQGGALSEADFNGGELSEVNDV